MTEAINITKMRELYKSSDIGTMKVVPIDGGWAHLEDGVGDGCRFAEEWPIEDAELIALLHNKAPAMFDELETLRIENARVWEAMRYLVARLDSVVSVMPLDSPFRKNIRDAIAVAGALAALSSEQLRAAVTKEDK